MEAIGAVAAVLQVAQIGTQLSIALYQIASSISSAAKEVTYIARDIALFSAVLKDLSRALDLGSKANLFRGDAFDTSIKIVGECQSVFTDIEDILKRVSKDEAPLHNKFEVPRLEKVLWYFRKGKVDFLRGVLDSLKSTILLELAVLDYATKVSSPLTKDTVNVDELLALKSLVLANETSTNDLRELAKTQDEGQTSLGPVASQGVATFHHSSASPAIRLLTQDAPAGELQHPTQITENNTYPVFSESTRDTCYPLEAPDHWTRIDRFEFALQRFNLAKWEHERIEENVALGSGNKPSLDDQRKEEFLLGRLRADMPKFGLDQALVERALKILQESGPWNRSRTEIRYMAPKTQSMMEYLELAGMPLAKDQNDASSLLVRRWLPDMFGDVLWEHTQEFLRQKGLLESIEKCDPTRSEIGALNNSPLTTQNKRETTDAGTQTDRSQAERKSVMRIASLLSMPAEQHLTRNTPGSGSGPQGRGTSFHNPQSTPARSDALGHTDVEDIHSSRPNIEPKEKVSKASTSHNTTRYGPNSYAYERYFFDELEEIHHENETYTAEWLDSLPELSAPIDQQQTGKPSRLQSDSADHRGTKRRRVDSSIKNMDQDDPNQHMSLDEHLMDLETDTLQSSTASDDEGYERRRNQDTIMTRASQRSQARNAPYNSQDAISMFHKFSQDAKMASIAATAGSEGSDFDFALYEERRQKGIEGRERFFQQERDSVLKSVDKLLRKWTYIDAPLAGQADKTAETAMLQHEEPD